MSFTRMLSVLPGLDIDLNGFVSGGVGAALVALVLYIVRLVLDRTIPSRSDSRANVTMLLEGLHNMVKVLQEEKVSDATRLQDKQKRIDELETAAEQDFDRIQELRAEVLDLNVRLAKKEHHIALLVTELRKLGAEVTGLDTEVPVNVSVVSPSTLSTPVVESEDSN